MAGGFAVVLVDGSLFVHVFPILGGGPWKGDGCNTGRVHPTAETGRDVINLHRQGSGVSIPDLKVDDVLVPAVAALATSTPGPPS